jgi:tRNA pseudouridine32 synthase / 23S rRNA pseudouridine746 synthase
LVTDAVHFFRMTEAEGPPNSETLLTCLGPLSPNSPWARYALEPSTGQRHQLRVHMNALGLPLRGDGWYPHVQHGPDAATDINTNDDTHPPLQLLAHTLAFADPLTGEQRRFVSTRQLGLIP